MYLPSFAFFMARAYGHPAGANLGHPSHIGLRSTLPFIPRACPPSECRTPRAPRAAEQRRVAASSDIRTRPCLLWPDRASKDSR